MSTTIKGPAIFLAQFAGATAPFNDWSSITRWAGGLGYRSAQVPSSGRRLFDLALAAEGKTSEGRTNCCGPRWASRPGSSSAAVPRRTPPRGA